MPSFSFIPPCSCTMVRLDPKFILKYTHFHCLDDYTRPWSATYMFTFQNPSALLVPPPGFGPELPDVVPRGAASNTRVPNSEFHHVGRMLLGNYQRVRHLLQLGPHQAGAGVAAPHQLLLLRETRYVYKFELWDPSPWSCAG